MIQGPASSDFRGLFKKIHLVLRGSFQVMSLLRGLNPQRELLSFRATPEVNLLALSPFQIAIHPGICLQIRTHHETSRLGFQLIMPGAARWPAYTYRSDRYEIAPKNEGSSRTQQGHRSITGGSIIKHSSSSSYYITSIHGKHSSSISYYITLD